MAIDLDFFFYQLAGLTISRYWMRWGLDLVRKSPWVTESFRKLKHLPLNDPHLPRDVTIALADDIERAKGQAERVSSRNREMLDRATYVYAYGALDSLLEACVKEIYLAQPKRLIGGEPTMRHLEAVRRLFEEKRTRKGIVDYFVSGELKGVRGKSLEDIFDYFKGKLGVDLSREWLDTLRPVRDRRNAAAHAQTFRVRSDTLRADLATIRARGDEAARLVGQTHGLQVNSQTEDAHRAMNVPLKGRQRPARGKGEHRPLSGAGGRRPMKRRPTES
jgi:hypothetical protein